MGLTSYLFSYAQKDSAHIIPRFNWSAYADIYYAFDFAQPASHERPSFLFNHTRHNEVNLNLGYIKATYASQKIRANLALMAGTYAQYNLASEQGLLKNIYEANVGIKLLTDRNIWFDAGIFSAHLGFESAVSKDCFTLTRSLAAENSPYYLSGAKLTYSTQNDKWLFSGLLLNGWQRIQRMAGNNSPAFGTQIQFKPVSKLMLNYSTFVGSDKPDSTKQMRYFHNLYATWQPTIKWALILGFDYGMEQNAKGSSEYNIWYVPTAIMKYSFTEKLAAAARAEYFEDAKGVIIVTGSPSGFKTAGLSFNVDYKTEIVLFRIEGKMYHSKDSIFAEGSHFSQNNYCITSSVAFAID